MTAMDNDSPDVWQNNGGPLPSYIPSALQPPDPLPLVSSASTETSGPVSPADVGGRAVDAERDPVIAAYCGNRAGLRLTRRGVLGLLGAGAAGVAGYGLIVRGGRSDETSGGEAAGDGSRPVQERKPVVAAGKAARTMVIIELEGGNDWLATLVPVNQAAVQSLRKATLPDMAKLIPVNDQFAANEALAATAKNTAFLHGVGTDNASGSHFEMMARWHAGDSNGKHLLPTGFLGRLCDELDAGAPVTGVSLAGNSPALTSRKSVTLGLPDGDGLDWLVSNDAWPRNLRGGIEALGQRADGEPQMLGAARTNLDRSLRFASLLSGLKEETKDYPGGELSDQLAIAAKLLAANAGIRVIHVRLGGFDTHSNQRGTHDGLLTQIDQAVAAFQADLAKRDLLKSTLIASYSEFGRRPMENDSGTDHGTAGIAMLWGPVTAGVHGEPISLTALDEHDNFRATTMMDTYYATLAEGWFGVDSNDVLPTKTKPIAGLFNE